MAENPFDTWATLQQTCPVAHTATHGGFYVLSRYDDCNRGLRAPKIYSSASGVTLPPTSSGYLIPAEVDPPAHRRYRNLVNAWFTTRAVAKFEPYLRERAVELITAAASRGTFDLVDEVAELFPRIAAFELLGFPRTDQPRVSRMIGESLGVGVAADELDTVVARGQAELFAYVLEIVEQRRTHGGGAGRNFQDLTDAIVHGQIDDRPLRDDEIQMTMLLMLYAGLHTTSVAMSGMLYWLGDHPEGRQRLREDPDLQHSAIEEFVRWTTPSGNQCRTLTEPVELHGYRLPTGSKVMLLDEAANRDPEQFPQPHDVLLDRHPNPHLGWGAGPHRCAGEHLGRLEMTIMLQEFLCLVPEYRIEHDQVRWNPGNARGLGHCPITVLS
jgi:cytochrome P450